MNDAPDKIYAERQILTDAQQRGPGATLAAYLKLSGPGWLQSAITLGGGSLAGSLYLGVLGGYTLLWLQPMAMILGIIMLSAIGYVTMSTGQRPFRAINEYVNPVLGWSWAIASLMANMVWCLPQFSLANSVLQQNLLPDLLGAESALGLTGGKVVVSAVLLAITIPITWSYGSGHWGVRLYEIMLKVMVAAIVLCFFLVVATMTSAGVLDWSTILQGFIPNPSTVLDPAPAFQEFLGQVDSRYRQFWTDLIIDIQLDRLIAAAATAVGINMTFLFPYSMLKKGWTKEFRGLQVFDLATGMFIPFVLATSCVVIAAASQFHSQPVPGLVAELNEASDTPTAGERKAFEDTMRLRLVEELGTDAVAAFDGESLAAEIERIPQAERMLGAMLVERDANQLSKSLAPLTGSRVANVLFGMGVIGMTLSTITLLMLISGFVICEMLDIPATGWPFRVSCLAASVGALGPFVWSRAGFALAIPTSVFGFMLLPIAYLTFFLLMNQRKLLGKEMPQGSSRVVWNLLMALAVGVATPASLYMVWIKTGWLGMGAIAALLGLALIVHFLRYNRSPK